MDRLPSELISHIMRFLSFSDRKEAALVCKTWYHAFLDPHLQKNVIIKCKPHEKGTMPAGLLRRRLTHIEFGDGGSQALSEENLVSLLKECPSLVELDLSRCNHLFLSGRLLDRESDRIVLRKSLANLRELKLECLRHMTDITFLRLVSVTENLQRISLASTNIIFGNLLCSVNQSSPVMFQFSTFLKFVQDNVAKLKSIDLSYTAVHNDALNALASIEGLCLDEISLKNCMELSDKGIKMLVSKQRSLKVLNISECKELGNSKAFFSTLANNLPDLQTLLMRKCVKMGQCDIESLADMRSLRAVDLGEVLNLFDKDLIKGMCSKGPQLLGLFLPYCPDIHDDFVFQLCKSNYLLTHLDLSSCLRLTDSALHAITRSLTLLRTLRLPYCREISDLGILGYMPENGVVPRHTFDHDHDGCPCTRERESKIFRKPKGLIKEHISYVSKAQDSLAKGGELYMLSNLEYLEILDLSACIRITDLGLSEAVRFRDLRSLSLNGLSKIDDRTIAIIAHHNPNLEEVNLRATKITDLAVGQLIRHCPCLRIMDLSQCEGLSDVCLETIAYKGKRLRHLDVSYTNLSVQAVSMLESRIPYLKVVSRPHLY